MLRDKKCSLFAWLEKEIFQVELPACGWDVSVLHTAVDISLRGKKSPFFLQYSHLPSQKDMSKADP